MSSSAFCFCLLLRPAPRSTLFPYTTLFRSGSGAQAALMLVGFVVGRLAPVTDTSLRFAFAGDRKSTRLNSSHGSISYAVFCLKKKKTDIQPVPARPLCVRQCLRELAGRCQV